MTLTFDILTPKCICIFLSPSCIYVWNTRYESCTLKTTQDIVSVLKYWQSSVVTLTFDILRPKRLSIIVSPSCINVWNMKAIRWKLLKLWCQNQSVDKAPLWPRPFDPKMYRYLPLTILHLGMKYQSCTLKTSQVIVLVPKCRQSSVVTLTFDPKMYGNHRLTILHLCMKNMKAVLWKLLKSLCQSKSVDKVPLWPWPLIFRP